MVVANAAPPTPKPKNFMNTTSKTTFITFVVIYDLNCKLMKSSVLMN